MFVSPAYAQTAGGEGSFLVSFLPLILIFVVFYFLLIRPQQTRMKQHRQMIENLKKGDQILTAGGIVGKIMRVEADNMLIVEIAPNVQVKVDRGTVSGHLNKTPQAANQDRAAGGGFLGGLFGGKK